MPGEHSRLPASSATRWLNCPGSVKMCELFPSESSSYAQEGTLAHALAESTLNGIPSAGKYLNLCDDIRDFYENHSELDDDGAAMEKYIESYVDYVKELFDAAKKEDASAIMLTEQRVDYGEYARDCWGTSDAIIIANKHMTVVDLKYGKGVPVDAPSNPQLRLYALGAWAGYKQIYEVEKITTVIAQPRLSHISTETLTADELRTWGETVILPASKRIDEHPDECHSGDWCRFCPGAGACKARAKECTDFVDEEEPKELLTLTPEELAKCLDRLDAINAWTKAVNDYALAQALDGLAIPGYKIVEGRAVRKYTDEREVAKAAVAAGYEEALIYERKLLTLSAMEKLMGKKPFAEVCGAYVEKPQGKPTLAPESDPRPATKTAATDFND